MGGDEDTGIDVVPDDMGMDADMPDMAAEMEAEIDWTQFDDDDADAVGAAFLDAVKQLQEENPDASPTAGDVVARMQEILEGGEEDGEGDIDDMEDEGDFEEEAPMADDEEATQLDESVNWLRRTNLLAGTGKRR